MLFIVLYCQVSITSGTDTCRQHSVKLLICSKAQLITFPDYSFHTHIFQVYLYRNLPEAQERIYCANDDRMSSLTVCSFCHIQVSSLHTLADSGSPLGVT